MKVEQIILLPSRWAFLYYSIFYNGNCFEKIKRGKRIRKENIRQNIEKLLYNIKLVFLCTLSLQPWTHFFCLFLFIYIFSYEYKFFFFFYIYIMENQFSFLSNYSTGFKSNCHFPVLTVTSFFRFLCIFFGKGKRRRNREKIKKRKLWR